ncbi:MAG: sensor histidine kinase [Muribaculaceae bacterium]|nr:sensor histidine kinase [Muribaculaceae bacterium]
MNGKLYWKQKLPIIFLNFLCMVGLAVFLRVIGNSWDGIFFILALWAVILAGYLAASYYSRKARLGKLLTLTEQLEERYLLSEVMEKPERADDQVYYRILKLAGKSMLEQVAEIRRERAQYKEYVEQWVHEIKTPITAMKLLCENDSSRMAKELLVELEKINCFTEQALYYARSEHTEKDYIVREIRLFDVVHRSLAENKYLLLQSGVRIEMQETDDMVYCDEKWVCFILNQLIVNSVKYRTRQPVLKFYRINRDNQVILCVEDNGIGIDAGDLPRIFEKGFTGQNGRKAAQNATGMGLYLCKRLCDKLGIGICVHSKGSGTIVQLIFYRNDLIQRVQD